MAAKVREIRHEAGSARQLSMALDPIPEMPGGVMEARSRRSRNHRSGGRPAATATNLLPVAVSMVNSSLAALLILFACRQLHQPSGRNWVGIQANQFGYAGDPA